MSNKSQKINVTSEIGTLKRVLIHSPDGGVGNVPTSKVHDWLYDDVVDVQQMQKEYNYFVIILLLFLDISKLFKNGVFFPKTVKFNPEHKDYFGIGLDESCVIDTQYCLAHLFFEDKEATNELISSISAIEGLNIDRKRDLQKLYEKALIEKPSEEAPDNNFILGISKFMDLAKTFITGKLEWEWNKEGQEIKKTEAPNEVNYIFPPIANFIFTRDIGVTIRDYIFITKPRFNIRKREVVLLKFIVEHYLLKVNKEVGSEIDSEKKIIESEKKIVEIDEDDDFFQIEDRFKDESRVSFEGGDIMMISEDHILIGCSERTSPYAIQKFIHRVFDDGLAKLISVIKISEKRSQMHIDTILSHLKKDTWIIFGQLSEKWLEDEKGKDWYRFEYADSIRQKSENQLKKEKLVTVIQFYCCGGHEKAENYQVYSRDEIDLLLLKKEISEEKAAKCQVYGNIEGFKYTKPTGLRDLLQQISVHDFGVEKKEDVKFIYSGGGVPPYDEREQWTDACNLLVIREGIAIGYDRNKKTAEAFENQMLGFGEQTPTKEEREKERKNRIESNQHLRDFLNWLMEKINKERGEQKRKKFGHPYELNFHVIHAIDLIEYFREKLQYSDSGAIPSFVQALKNTLILLPSNELSRARGGSHCMTMPLWRENIK